MAKSPRMPFPSFTLALSRQEAGDNESNNDNQEKNASNVEPPVDLMVSFRDRQFTCFTIVVLSLLGRKHLILVYHAMIVAGKWYVLLVVESSIDKTFFFCCLYFFILSVIQRTKTGQTQKRSLRNELTSWRLAKEASMMEAENEIEVW